MPPVARHGALSDGGTASSRAAVGRRPARVAVGRRPARVHARVAAGARCGGLPRAALDGGSCVARRLRVASRGWACRDRSARHETVARRGFEISVRSCQTLVHSAELGHHRRTTTTNTPPHAPPRGRSPRLQSCCPQFQSLASSPHWRRRTAAANIIIAFGRPFCASRRRPLHTIKSGRPNASATFARG